MKHPVKRIFLMMAAALACLGKAGARQVTIRVTNPTDCQRQEVVEADLSAICQQLGVDAATPLTVTNAIGQQQPYQRSYDGRLLLYVAVQPRGTAVLNVAEGQPETFKNYVHGRIYPERADDLTWENDRSIYRFYGPALQRSGEKSYGTDIWVKNTPEPVAEERYRVHLEGMHRRDSLKRAGRQQEATAVNNAASFHLDHGYGMDVYSVGATLGCGAPALMRDGHLLFPWCFKQCKILDNGPLRFTADLTYGTTADGTTEHRLVTLDRGSHFNRITVSYDGLSQPQPWATGVVLHEGAAATEDARQGKNPHVVATTDYVLYADPTDNARLHQSQIYVGTLFPTAVDRAEVTAGKASHALGIVDSYRGEPYTYYFGSAWSAYDVRSMAQWRLVADEYLQCLKAPLQVTVSQSE